MERPLAPSIIGDSRLLALVILILLASGCTTLPPAFPPEHRDVGELQQWRLEGKLGFRSPEKNGSAWLSWSQTDQQYKLQLHGPFGAAATRIEGDNHHAILSQSGREDIEAPSGEELSQWLFGWTFPVNQMVFWVKGQAAPSPEPEASVFNGEKSLTLLQQNSWNLHYSEYQRYGNWLLPGRIEGTQGSYSFVLVIKNWQPGWPHISP